MRYLSPIVTAALIAIHSANAHADDNTPTGIPVLAELFTSEGCSSCPPADALLREYVAQQPFKGIELIAVAQHVDYWDQLGWEDPFGDAAYSGLQHAYAENRGDGRVHTPQLIINGEQMVVGNYAPVTQQAIQWGARNPVQRLNVQLQAVDAGRLRVQSVLPLADTAPTGNVRVLLVESGLSTQVRRGENRGKELHHPPIARHSVELTAPRELDIHLPLPDDINPANSRIIVIWQQAAGAVRAVGHAALAPSAVDRHSPPTPLNPGNR